MYPVKELRFVSTYLIWKQVASVTYVHILTFYTPMIVPVYPKSFLPLHTFRITMVTFLSSCLIRQIIFPTMFDCGDTCIVCNSWSRPTYPPLILFGTTGREIQLSTLDCLSTKKQHTAGFTCNNWDSTPSKTGPGKKWFLSQAHVLAPCFSVVSVVFNFYFLLFSLLIIHCLYDIVCVSRLSILD